MDSADIAADMWFSVASGLVIVAFSGLAFIVRYDGRKGLKRWLHERSRVAEAGARYASFLREAASGRSPEEWQASLLEALHALVDANRRRAQLLQRLQNTYLGVWGTLVLAALGSVSCVLSDPRMPVAALATSWRPFLCGPAVLVAFLTLFFAHPIIALFFDHPPRTRSEDVSLGNLSGDGTEEQPEPPSQRSQLR